MNENQKNGSSTHSQSKSTIKKDALNFNRRSNKKLSEISQKLNPIEDFQNMQATQKDQSKTSKINNMDKKDGVDPEKIKGAPKDEGASFHMSSIYGKQLGTDKKETIQSAIHP
jgi:hypothetical protein